jgi:hypothetical protein
MWKLLVVAGVVVLVILVLRAAARARKPAPQRRLENRGSTDAHSGSTAGDSGRPNKSNAPESESSSDGGGGDGGGGGD